MLHAKALPGNLYDGYKLAMPLKPPRRSPAAGSSAPMSVRAIVATQRPTHDASSSPDRSAGSSV